MRSLGHMLELLSGLSSRDGISEWEARFIANNFERYTEAGKSTESLSSKVVEIIESLHKKYFG